MEASLLLNSTVSVSPSSPTRFLHTNKAPPPSSNSRCAVRSLARKNNDANGFSSGSSQLHYRDYDKEVLEGPATENNLEMSKNDIWRLFNDAQKNILYLNKQRLMAIDELKKVQKEKESLLAIIEQSEERKQEGGQSGLSTPDQNLSFSQLLFRIDSMVLQGIITTGEASRFRNFVMDSRVNVINSLHGIHQKEDKELLAELRQFSDRTVRKGLHIVHICTEMEPVVSVGSLASYVTGLSRALIRKGNLVEVMLPKYTSLNLDEVQGLRKIEAEFTSFFGGRWHGNRIWTGIVHGIGVIFIEPLYHSTFFQCEQIYGYSDDFERFSYFSRACLDYLVKSGKQPDILHIHNWETAIVGPLFWDIFVNQGLGDTRILFTCHNFNPQCLEPPNKLALCGLDPNKLHRLDRLQDSNKTHLVNLLKGGIVYSNKVVAVSSFHSKERIIHSATAGLESTLAIHREKLLITPHGFEDTTWDPSKDELLPAKYSANNLKGKAVCKIALRQRLGLSGHASAVVVGYILSETSGIDMEDLKIVVWNALRKGVQFVFMRLNDTPAMNSAWESFQSQLKDADVRFINKYDEALLHLVLAGCDIILCSTFDDPMTQTPLKAIKYGAAPIAVKSRNNMIRPHDGHDLGSTSMSQYMLTTFANMSLDQAIDEIRNDPTRWKWIINDGMSRDFSWNAECHDIHWAAYMSIKNL